jgi:hypothetical protein
MFLSGDSDNIGVHVSEKAVVGKKKKMHAIAIDDARAASQWNISIRYADVKAARYRRLF